MVLAIDQPNYIPWKGYFDIIHDVDLFVFYNDVQYTTRDWRNRNKILTPNGEKWLTVPVGNDTRRLIYEVEMADTSWQKNHFDTIRFAYGKAPYFKKYADFLEEVYLKREWKYLYELDQYMTVHIAQDFLGLKTRFADSRDYTTHGVKHEKLLSLIESVGNVSVYESGPAAKNYMIEQDYINEGIEIRWKSYAGYPEYPQNSDVFTHQISILDLLFHVGEEAPYYIWGWREDARACSWE